MSALRRAVPAVLLLLLLPLFWIGAFRAGSELQAMPACVFLRYQSWSVVPEELQRLRESEAENEQPLPFSAFSQLSARPVQSKNYGRKTQADILLFDGDLRQILQAGLPEEDFAFSQDDKGCALDRDTAFALWGSDRIEGETLLFEGEEYIVRAVLDAPKRTVVLPALQQTALSVLALETLDGQDERLQAEQFYQRHGLPVPDALTTSSWYLPLCRFFCLLPVLLPVGALLAAILRELWEMRKTPVLCLLWSLLTAAIFCGLAVLSGVHFSFPQSMVPTRWSDFEFWSRLLRSFFESLRSALLTPVLAPDRTAGTALIKLILYSLLAAADMAALMVIYRKKVKQRG
ncbi:MAG: hypothetical protein HFG27_04600 [Provencibacterium sp.]|nr:hypothetical protein [Provencibacterium sp.]